VKDASYGRWVSIIPVDCERLPNRWPCNTVLGDRPKRLVAHPRIDACMETLEESFPVQGHVEKDRWSPVDASHESVLVAEVHEESVTKSLNRRSCWTLARVGLA
jgi:hypothetical protein